MVDLMAPLRRFRPYWLVSAGIFLATILLGAASGVGGDRSSTLPVIEGGFRFEELTVRGIFLNNVAVVFVMLVGLILAGLPTLYVLGLNGLTTGVVIVDSAAVNGVVPTMVALVPHGIVELPAVWLAAAIVFRLLHAFWRTAQGERLSHPVHVYIADTLLALLLVVLLLLIAAVIEVWITPRILQLVL